MCGIFLSSELTSMTTYLRAFLLYFTFLRLCLLVYSYRVINESMKCRDTFLLSVPTHTQTWLFDFAAKIISYTPQQAFDTNKIRKYSDKKPWERTAGIQKNYYTKWDGKKNYPLMQVILATDLCEGLMVVRVPSLRISASSWCKFTNSASMATKSPEAQQTTVCKLWKNLPYTQD